MDDHRAARQVKQFKVYLPEDLIRQLKHAAVETEQSLSALVTDAVRKHIDDLQHKWDQTLEGTNDGR